MFDKKLPGDPAVAGLQTGVKSAKHRELIGTVVSIWPRVEYNISFMMGILISEDAKDFLSTNCEIVFYSMREPGARSKMMTALLNQRNDRHKLPEICEKSVEAYKQLSKARNRIVHSLWWTEIGGCELYIESEGPLNKEKEWYHVREKDFEAFFEKCTTLSRRLMSYKFYLVRGEEKFMEEFPKDRKLVPLFRWR